MALFWIFLALTANSKVDFVSSIEAALGEILAIR